MAFRRRPFNRRTFIPKRRGPPLARVRRTWFSSFLHNICDPVPLPLQSCLSEGDPENDLRIILVDQTTLQDQFSDRARVRRIVGDIWYYGTFLTPLQDLAAAIAADSALDTFQNFTGLRKDETSFGQPFGTPYEPMLNDFDFSEAEWIKTWQTAQANVLDRSVGAASIAGVNFPVAESNVSTTNAACVGQNNFVTGTGTICVETTTDVNCYNCENTAVPINNVHGRAPRLHHFHIDHRRPIRLRENEQLMLQMAFLFPYIETLVANEPTLYFFGGIKTLLEF